MRELRSVIILMLALIPAPAYSQRPGTGTAEVKIPESKAGKIAADFISAFNSDDSDMMNQFALKYLNGELINSGLNVMTGEKYLKIFSSLKAQTKTLIPADIRENGDPGYLGIIFMTEKPVILGVEFFTDKTGSAFGRTPDTCKGYNGFQDRRILSDEITKSRFIGTTAKY